jgi:hypothetical protein
VIREAAIKEMKGVEILEEVEVRGYAEATG